MFLRQRAYPIDLEVTVVTGDFQKYVPVPYIVEENFARALGRIRSHGICIGWEPERRKQRLQSTGQAMIIKYRIR